MRKTSLFVLMFLVSCVSQNPGLFLGNTSCTIPCWFGLIPGKSTVEETQNIVQTLSFVSPGSVETVVFSDTVSLRWSFMGEVAGGGTVVFDRDKTIQEIRIRTIGLSLGLAIDKLGTPEKVWAGYFPGDTVHYDLALYYPKKGIVIHTHDKPSDNLYSGTERIVRDLQVSEIQFVIPTSVEEFLTRIEKRSPDNISYILNKLQPWPGFGENVVRVEPP